MSYERNIVLMRKMFDGKLGLVQSFEKAHSTSRDAVIAKAYQSANAWNSLYHDASFIVGEATVNQCIPGWSDFKPL